MRRRWLFAGAAGLAGAVSDASFAHTPVDGTMAVDTTDDKLYVRVKGRLAVRVAELILRA